MNNIQKSFNTLSATLTKRIKDVSTAVEGCRKMFKIVDDEFTERDNVTDRRLDMATKRLELVERFLALPWYKRIFHNLPSELRVELQKGPEK